MVINGKVQLDINYESTTSHQKTTIYWRESNMLKITVGCVALFQLYLVNTVQRKHWENVLITVK